MKPSSNSPNVVHMVCPACERRARWKPGDPLTMHSRHELTVCMALKEGVSVAEIERRWEKKDAYLAANRANPEMIVEQLVFNESAAAELATISLYCDLGSLIFSARLDVKGDTLPVPPIGTKIPNTFCVDGPANTFEERKLIRDRCREQEAVLQPFMKTIAEIRMLHLPTLGS